MTYQQMPDYMLVPMFQMPLTAQTVFLYAMIVLAAVTMIWAIYRAKVENSLTPVFYCLGGGLTCFLEALLTRLLDATHAQEGQVVMYESLGQLVPWHAAISYTFYFGLTYLILVPKFRDRIYSERTIWWILIAITVSAWIYEVPLVMVGLWAYYGEQPYQIFGLQPFYWSFASMAMLVVPVTLIARYEAYLTGWRKLLIVPLAPIGAIAGAAGASWPIWLALNSSAGYEVKFFAATLTIAFSLLIAALGIPLVAARKPAEAQAGSDAGQSYSGGFAAR